MIDEFLNDFGVVNCCRLAEDEADVRIHLNIQILGAIPRN
jgi:hypothetical protein